MKSFNRCIRNIEYIIQITLLILFNVSMFLQRSIKVELRCFDEDDVRSYKIPSVTFAWLPIEPQSDEISCILSLATKPLIPPVLRGNHQILDIDFERQRSLTTFRKPQAVRNVPNLSTIHIRKLVSFIQLSTSTYKTRQITVKSAFIGAISES